jgi:short-subunit dehydrogenase
MAFARRLAAEGFNCALVARRVERLDELATELRARHGIETRVIAEDLERERAAERVAAALDGLDVGMVVNNAGFGAVGRFERVPHEKILGMVRLNCVAVAALAHVFLGPMKARGRGAMIIVASAAGYQPLGFSATYAATKAFDLMLGEALWAENRGTGVDVVVVSPGPVDTEFQAVAGEVAHPGVSADTVVEVALGALGRKPSVVVGTFNKARAWMIRLAPRAQVARLALGVMRSRVPQSLR